MDSSPPRRPSIYSNVLFADLGVLPIASEIRKVQSTLRVTGGSFLIIGTL